MAAATIRANLRCLSPGVALSLMLAVASWYLAMVPGLKVMGALTVALLVGIAWRLAAGLPDSVAPGSRFAARDILRWGIVLMGARLDFGLIARVGIKILTLDALVVLIGIVGISWLARKMGVPPKLALLMAVGNSICGASAVAAAAPVAGASEDDVTLAAAMCGILGTVGVLFYLGAGPFLGVTTTQLAVMSGSSLHEIAQVMAAAFTWGPKAGALGTLVKLTRIVLLAPALLVLSLTSRQAGSSTKAAPPLVPPFVFGFLALGALASFHVISPMVVGWLANASLFLMVVAMAAMGLNTHVAMVKKAGAKILYAGLAGFALLVATSWLGVHLLHIG